MLLPDAPPRKRQTKRKSPERQPCVMAGDSVRAITPSDVEPNTMEPEEPVASTSRSSAAPSYESAQASLHNSPEYYTVFEIIDEPNTMEPEEPVASTSSSSAAPSYEPNTMEPEEPVASTSSSSAAPSYEPNTMEPEEPVASTSSSSAAPSYESAQAPQSSHHVQRPSEIAVENENYNKILTEWLQLTDDMPGTDDDSDIEDDSGLIPNVERCTVTEPACVTDLTDFEAEVLRREDNDNDQAIRDIMPNDELYTFTWNKERSTFLGQRETFTGTPGPTFDVTEQTQAIDIFDKTFDVGFIDYLCRETNRNAEQKIGLLRQQNNLATHSRFNRWTTTDRNEMVSFLAIIILQGLYPLPEEEAYFTFNGYGTMPFFAKIMTYNRFLLLKTFIHFVDSQTCQDKTRLSKIRSVIDYLNDKFSSMYMPSQEIAIDESLLKWHGRLSFAQKISSKAAQVGVKTYELCESSSGYLWKFFVYAGKDKPTDRRTNDRPAGDEAIEDDETNETPDNDGPTATGESQDRPTNATAKIVYDLIEPLLHRGHTVIMDNFYNSPLLLRSLKNQKTDCYGTLRLNREFVPDTVKTLTKTDLRQGEVVATYCSDLTIMVWRDANLVSMISTYHNVQVGRHDKYNRQTYKPTIVLDYNKSMGGVDRKDQFLSAQPVERTRNRVWYKKLFRRLFSAAIFNGYVIFSGEHRYRTVLAEALLTRHRQLDLTTESRRLSMRSISTGQVTTTTKRYSRPKTQARPTVDANHFPIRTGSKFTCCAMCPKKTRTIWKCEECDVNLCIDGCFKAYHKP